LLTGAILSGVPECCRLCINIGQDVEGAETTVKLAEAEQPEASVMIMGYFEGAEEGIVIVAEKCPIESTLELLRAMGVPSKVPVTAE
jgi:hypothetical protein